MDAEYVIGKQKKTKNYTYILNGILALEKANELLKDGHLNAAVIDEQLLVELAKVLVARFGVLLCTSNDHLLRGLILLGEDYLHLKI